MPAAVAQKLKIKAGYSLRTLNAPAEFKTDLGELPEGVRLSATAKAYDQVHWFVKNKATMEAEMDKILDLLKGDVVCWIYYPKGTSKLQTDLTRDKGWERLLKHTELHWISLISFNENWSAFGMRLKTEGGNAKEAKLKERPIFNYIDAVKKTISLPEDFSGALAENKKEAAFFDQLSFTNKKEYLEWIVTAKREETRITRVQQSIERLAKGWKNPANR